MSISTPRVALFIVMMCCVTSITLVTSATADEAQRAFDVLFGQKVAEVSKTSDRADDIALAKEMLKLTTTFRADGGGDDALLVLLCENARELTQRHPEGYSVAIEALETLAGTDPERQLGVEEEVADLLTRQIARARGDDQQQTGDKLIALLMSMSDAHVQQSNYLKAASLTRRAIIAATRIKSSQLETVKARLDEVLHYQRVGKKS